MQIAMLKHILFREIALREESHCGRLFAFGLNTRLNLLEDTETIASIC